MNWEIAATCVGLGMTVVGSANYFLIRALLEGQKEIKAELKLKTSLDTCMRMRGDCMKLRDMKEGNVCEETRDIWDVFNHHGHEGLPPNAKVTRG